ncbi:MAG: FecR family protein [Verrucomicrobiaceae bacterium]|nr:FecR family protein [Verrucomicrobiaceae bacterium]
MSKHLHLRIFAASFLLAAAAHGASLKQAEFTRVINDVRVMPIQQQPAPAKVGDKISGQTGVSTGSASRAELQFPDKTLTRIGANTVFRLDKADRTVDLEKGVMLLQVPKQIGGAKVRTAAVTAAVTGTTVMMEYDPNGTLKIIVLEGEVDVYLNDNPGEMRTLVAGDMLIVNLEAMKVRGATIPLPVKVDLELLRRTSKLMSEADFGALGNQKHLAGALDEQAGLKKNGELLATAFEIMGRGTQVTLTSEARQEIFKNITLRDRDGSNSSGGNGGGNGGNGTGSNGAAGDGRSNTDGSTPGKVLNQPILNAGTTVFGTGSSIVTNPHATAFNSISNSVVTMQGTIYSPATDGFFNTYMYGDPQTFPDADTYLAGRGNWFVFKGEELYISGQIDVNTTPGPRNIILGAIGSVRFTSSPPFSVSGTDNQWNLPLSVDALMVTAQHGSISMDSSFSLQEGDSESGQHQELSFYAYGPSSDVLIQGGGLEGPDSIYFSNGIFQAYAGRDIVLTGAQVAAGEVALTAGRDVTVTSGSIVHAKTSLRVNALGNIHVQNSSQLRALSATDPLSILLKASNGNVEVLNSYVDATNLDMLSERGGVMISNASILADVIKARVLDAGGQLYINGSVLGRDIPAANSLIKLYGEGASGVRFSGDNTLNAVNVDIAGKTVTIDNGSLVRLSHPGGTRVYSDTANFNNGTHGNFTNKTGTPVTVNQGSFNSRPPY